MRLLRMAIVLVVFGLPSGSGTLVSARQHTDVLPIDAFLDTLPVTAFQLWSDPVSGDLLLVDAFGKRAGFFGLEVGTAISGNVTVNDLGDGTERVAVNLHTTNAICWGFNGALEPAFGYLPRDVFNGLGRASLGDVHMRLEFIQPVGPLNQGGQNRFVSVSVRCDGELRFGSGEPDGTPGSAHTTQVGVFQTGVPDGCPPEQDGNCFPTEKVRFTPRKS